MPVVLVLQDEQNGKTYTVKESSIIGRGADAGIRIRDPLLSRHHCRVDIAEGRYQVCDLKSYNGTYVNGHRIEAAPLMEGDEVRIGSQSLNCHFVEDFDPIHIEGFEFQRKLGEGTIGTVFLAKQQLMGKLVAVKIMNPECALDPRKMQIFMREAMAGGQLDHANLIKIYDAAEVAGIPYIVMEYVDGTNLFDILSSHGVLHARDALHIAIQIASALEHAFERKLVHRDIKPSNIIVTSAGIAKLTDFGLAKNFESAGTSGLTHQGAGKGTLHYMPPEQVSNAISADQRADIYSLAATIYHLVTGHYPREGKNLPDFIMKILKQDVPEAMTVNPNVPKVVSDVLAKAMQRDINARYQVPSEFHAALRHAWTSLGY